MAVNYPKQNSQYTIKGVLLGVTLGSVGPVLGLTKIRKEKVPFC